MTLCEIHKLCAHWGELADCCHEPDRWVSAAEAVEVTRTLLAVVEAAKNADIQCANPISDSDGDGVWVTQTWLDCGECASCALINALAALEAP
jgi:hypothetical protein